MIPQLVRKVGRVAQQGIEVSHDSDDGACLSVAFVAIFDEHQRVDHLVNVSPIFGQEEAATCVVVILFHCLCIVA